MVKRARPKSKSRKKTAKPRRKKTVHRKSSLKTIESDKEIVAKNRKAHWSVYQDLQKKADRAWDKLRSDVARKASPRVLLEDRDNLLLLLGECNYLAGECTRMNRSR